MPGPAQRAPKGRTRDRADRRATLDVLLARLARGILLTPAEAALLTDYVREEQRLADENRRAMVGTTRTLERHRAAADSAIRELEADLRVALDLVKQAERRAERAEAALDRVRAAVNALCHEPHPSHDHVCPDHIAAVVQAALNAEQVDPAEPAPAPVEPATPLPAPPPIPTPDAPDVDRSHDDVDPDDEPTGPLVPAFVMDAFRAHDASLKQHAAAVEAMLDQTKEQ